MSRRAAGIDSFARSTGCPAKNTARRESYIYLYLYSFNLAHLRIVHAPEAEQSAPTGTRW